MSIEFFELHKFSGTIATFANDTAIMPVSKIQKEYQQ